MEQLISILLPVYNAEAYLPECLESIAAQTYTNIEVIIIDDGSCDRSMDICREFANTYPQYSTKIFICEHLGVSAARNRAIREAEGEILAFVDADDVIAPEYLEVMYNVMQKYNTDVVCCGVNIIDHNGRILYPHGQNTYFINRVLDIGDSVNAYLVFTIRHEPWGRLVKKTLHESVSFTEGIYYEDIIPSYELIKSAKGIYITDKYLYHYRENTTGVVHTALTDLQVLQDKYNSFNNIISAMDDCKINREFMDRFIVQLLYLFRTDFITYQSTVYKAQVMTGEIDYDRMLALYGAGQIGREYAKANRRRFTNCVFIDRDESKKSLLGYPVITPDEYCRRYLKDYKIILTCRFIFSAAKELLRIKAVENIEQLMLNGGTLPIEKELSKAFTNCLSWYEKIVNEDLKREC